MKNVLVILGTRPEVIKLAPIILELQKYPERFTVFVCNTEQQKELTNQTLAFFNLTADINLNVMRINQSLANVQTRIMEGLENIFLHKKIDISVVQGDTITAFCGALVSYYHRIPLCHVEAGLRSKDLHEPFPEEAMRQMISRIATWHFSPTEGAVQALLSEGIEAAKVSKTGNTVIDALHCLSPTTIATYTKKIQKEGIELNDRVVLVTVHRRENHGSRLDAILMALTSLAASYPEHQFILPTHPNPNIKTKVFATLSPFTNVKLLPPLDYPALVVLLSRAKLVLTDSGGIQEEAPTFGVPILVMRYKTERTEGLEAGVAELVGADTKKIILKASAILEQSWKDTRNFEMKNPYGDGHAAEKIVGMLGDDHA